MWQSRQKHRQHNMKIYLGTDHAGFELKEKIKALLSEKGYDVADLGAYNFDKNDDYTDFISKVAAAVSLDPGTKGIVLGGSGQAEAILANKYKGIRAALFYGPVVAKEAIDANGDPAHDGYDLIRLSRIHNDANILSLGARFVTEEEALKAVTIWLETPFAHEERHMRRIEKIAEIERSLGK